MAERIQPDARARELLEPVWDRLMAAASRLPEGPPVTVCGGDVPGFGKLVGHTLVLSEPLFGRTLHHPEETPSWPLDRWRRAASCVLEAAAALVLARHAGRDAEDDWRWRGAALWMAANAAPEMGLDRPALVRAVTAGDLGRYPAAGIAVFEAWKALGHDPWKRLWYLLGGGVVSSAEWLEVGAWVLAGDGLSARLESPAERVSTAGLPCALGPWAWRPLDLDAHPRGGQIEVEGEGAIGDPWAPAGRHHRTILAAVGSCRFKGTPGGPVGTWEVRSAQGFGQVMGARGVTFVFHGSGRLELVLADAFVGPLAALSVAEQVGTSGLVAGTWEVSGNREMSFRGIDPKTLTMHGRDRDPFRVPARGLGMGSWLGALCDHPWSWRFEGPVLRLEGNMFGGAVEVRLQAPAPAT